MSTSDRTEDTSSRSSVLTASLLAAVTAATLLFTQVLVHRLVSAKLLNNYAFLVISLTMLGLASSGVALVRWLPSILADRADRISICAALFAISLPVSTWVFCRAPAPLPLPYRGAFVVAFLQTVPVALVFAVPFFFTGLILGVLLSDPSLSTPRVYFADLVGSSLGALAAIPALRVAGVERGLLAAAFALLVATLVLERPRRAPARLLALLASLGLGGAALAADTVFALRTQVPSLVEGLGPPYRIEHMAWDAVARIEVTRIPPPRAEGFNYPSLIGTNERFHERFQRALTQNNYAFTYALDYDGNPTSLSGIDETIYSAAYHATSVKRPRVLIIGVGGGFDVLTGIFFDASEITGVEVNGATIEILTRTYEDYFRSWVKDPRVHLVAGEGRQYLEEHPGPFDVLQVSGVDSYSGTAAAANVFSENYLYTAEAFDLYLSRLGRGGILNLMRLEYEPPREMLRALTTAVAALRRAGVQNPADHVVMLTSTERNFTALLLKRAPFTKDELDRVYGWADQSRVLHVSAGPGRNAPARNAYQAFLVQEDARREALFVGVYEWDISPTTDDRPFFFKYSFLRHVFSDDPQVAPFAPMLEYSALLLLACVGLAAVGVVYLPLRFLASGPARGDQTRRYACFFAGTGLGYLAIEVGLLQKFGLFLGHPNYALSVVLAGLLFSTGVGSLVSGRVVSAFGSLRFVGYALAGVVLVETLAVMPRLGGWVTLPFALRCALVLGMVFPIGFLLGCYVPTALERLKREAPEFVPWAWGVNGIFSVMAPILAVWFSTSWGMSALIIAALPIYLLVGAVLPAPRSPVATAA
jgi:predicted membrane-bound spermidine synthase